jgi:rhodanese-related sulfurtransferase
VRKIHRTLISVFLLAIVSLLPLGSFGAEVKRITKEEVKEMLGSPDLIIIDVRQSLDWEKNELKIKGAVREDPDGPTTWIEKYPKEKTIVFYCS